MRQYRRSGGRGAGLIGRFSRFAAANFAFAAALALLFGMPLYFCIFGKIPKKAKKSILLLPSAAEFACCSHKKLK